MPLNIPTGFGQANYVFTSASGTAPFVTTMGLDLSATDGDYVLCADSAFNSYVVSFMANTHNSITLTKVSLQVGVDGTGSSYDSSLAPVPGGASFEPEPFAMAAIARKITNTGGRAGRGRMFLPGLLQESSVNPSGQLSSGSVTELTSNVAEYLAALTTGAGTISTPAVLLHNGDGSPSPVVAMSIASKVGWIRGRIY